jgi:3-dehydroquinate dehydratase-1
MKIVVPIMPKSLSEIAQLDQSKYVGADIIEWRADFLPLADLPAAGQQVKAKFTEQELIFTYRTEDKAEKNISDTAYADLITQFAGQFDYIDVEKFSFPEIELPDNAIFSYHDFKRIPDNLADILSDMTAAAPRLVKFAGLPRNQADVLRLMSETLALSEKYENQTFVTMAMGKLGKITRIASDSFGSRWTFAAVDTASAPGQLSLSDLLKIREVL